MLSKKSDLRILIPLPTEGFDPTETAVPWKILKKGGVKVSFATPRGKVAQCDLRMLTGKGLGPLSFLLAANLVGREAYLEMSNSAEFRNPLTWAEIDPQHFDGIILPGGHAKGMREYLESEKLQSLVADFIDAGKATGAICHGVVLASRSRSKKTGKSVLYGKKTTALLSSQEMFAWNLTRLWLGDYYRTYSVTVEAEVKKTLQSPSDFLKGSFPLFRDNMKSRLRGYVVVDRNYVSARWPGDAHRFAFEFLRVLQS